MQHSLKGVNKEKMVNTKKIELTYFVSGMWCSSCAKRLSESISRLPSIENANVNYITKLLSVVTGDSKSKEADAIIQKTIIQNGFSAKKQNAGWIKDFKENLKNENEKKLSWVMISVVWFLAMWSTTMAFSSYLDTSLTSTEKYYLTLVSALFGLPAIAIGIQPYLISGYRSLIHAKILTLDLFIACGGITAFLISCYYLYIGQAISYADSGAMVLAILLLTKKIENIISLKLSSSILFQLGDPKSTVLLLKDDQWVNAYIDQIKKNQYIKVLIGETIPCDGVLKSKSALINNHLSTGESMPVDIKQGDHVFAGAICLKDIEILVTNPQGQRKIDRWAEMAFTKNSSKSKHPNQFSYAENILVGMAFTGAIGIALFNTIKGYEIAYITESFFIGILIFCPCLFASILPLSKQMTHLALLKMGVLINRSSCLWDMTQIKDIFFDKTGTLEFVESSFEYLSSDLNIDSELKQISLMSKHPILRGLNIKSDYSEKTTSIKSIKEVAGKGLIAEAINDKTIVIGSKKFIAEQKIKNNYLQNDLLNYPLVALNNVVIGYIVTKEIYNSASETLLKKLSSAYPKFNLSIISGDSKPDAGKNFKLLNKKIKFYGGLSPDQKAQMITEDSLFIGDGINDSLALSKAMVSIRYGNRTLGFGPVDLQFIQPNIQQIIAILKYAKKYKKVLLQTVVLAFLYNIIAITLALNGLFSPLGAVLAMSTSFILLLTNSLRLLSPAKA